MITYAQNGFAPTRGLLGVKSAGLTLGQPLPVRPYQRTSSDRLSWSGSCHLRKSCLQRFFSPFRSERSASSWLDISWNEIWNGTEQRRHYRIEGDRLFIDLAPAPSITNPGKTDFRRLVWEREK